MKNGKKLLTAALALVLTLTLATTALACGRHGSAARSTCTRTPGVCAWVDADRDGVCDNCKGSFVDEDGDGVCDNHCRQGVSAGAGDQSGRGGRGGAGRGRCGR